jgi:tetratricopeptide (TPR) repeat protein
LDIDGKAIAFAREFEPEAELIHGDIRTRAVDLSGSIALIVDVLGLVTDPVHILRSVARRTSRLEFLFVAEPIAQCTQRLVAPARRAFSVPSLRSLFARSGFAIDQLIDLDDGMRCAIGHVMHEPASGYLLRAERAYLSHQTQLFLEACELVQRSSNSALRVEAALLEARLWFDLDRRDRAIAALSDARFLAPDDPRPLAGLSRLALASGSHAQAIRLAAEAVKADPTDFSATCSSALAHASGDPDRSFCAWETANALVPDDPAIVRLLCAAALAEGRYDEALLVIERLSQYGEKISQLDKHVGLAYLAATAAEASGRAAEIARATPGDGNEQAREPLEALLELSLSTLSTRPI